MPRPFPRRIGALLAACTVLLAAATPAQARSGPVISTFSAAFAYGLVQPGLDPRGANDFACKPTAAHPRPVVLLHGTFANRFNSFAALAPAIRRQGYCVFAPDYGAGPLRGINGTAALRRSSREVAAFVDRVLAATGAAQVDLVGYSQGGVVARAYLKYDGGADPADPAQSRVASLIGLSAVNHGTPFGGLASAVARYDLGPLLAPVVGQGGIDLLEGSSFLTALGDGGETVPGVAYTLIGTRTDEISVPFRNAFLTASPGATVRNIVLQQGCPTDFSDHFNLPYSPRATAYVLRALDPTYGGRLPCGFVLPGI